MVHEKIPDEFVSTNEEHSSFLGNSVPSSHLASAPLALV